QSSQIEMPVLAISSLTWRCDLPQRLQRSCSLPSLARAIPYSFYPRLAETASPKCSGGRFCLACFAVADHGVDDPVLLCFLRTEEEVSLHVVRNLFLGLAGVLRVDLLQAALEADHLAGLDLDVGALPLEP